MNILEVAVIALALGNILSAFAAYMLGRSSGARRGYAQGLRVANAWKVAFETATTKQPETLNPSETEK